MKYILINNKCKCKYNYISKLFYYIGNDLTQADPHQLVECIKRVFDQNYSSLGSLFEDSMDIIASEMLQAGQISRHVAKKPTFHL